MNISRMQENESLIDYESKIACIIFTSGCNFACSSCHARQIVFGNERIDEKKVFNYLNERKSWIDALVICGGEPTIQHDLERFCLEIKERQGSDFCIKLDTNGSTPEVLGKLLERKLVDYVALDIKAPRELYPKVIGVDFDLTKIEETIRILAEQPAQSYEFRTTIAPILRKVISTNPH